LHLTLPLVFRQFLIEREGITFIIQEKNVIPMAEIILNVPDELPLPSLIARLKDLIAEEHLKWMLFIKSVDVLAINETDMKAFEEMRDVAWMEKKKEFGL